MFQNLQAQTADEIIAKNIEVMGGKDKIMSIITVKTENMMQVMGNDSSPTTILVVGKAPRTESDFGGQKMIQVLTDKGRWAVKPIGGSNDPKPIPDEVYKKLKDHLDFSPFNHYPMNKTKAELAVKEMIGNTQSYKLNYTSENSLLTTFLIDTASYFILRIVKKANLMEKKWKFPLLSLNTRKQIME